MSKRNKENEYAKLVAPNGDVWTIKQNPKTLVFIGHDGKDNNEGEGRVSSHVEAVETYGCVMIDADKRTITYDEEAPWASLGRAIETALLISKTGRTFDLRQVVFNKEAK